MSRPKFRHTILKMLGLFSSVRGYNILMVCIAQYLAAIFILSQRDSVREVVFDINLLILVAAGALAIAGGYIINGFYDKEKDLINSPLKSMVDRLVGQNTKLTLYFLLNFISVIVASYVSFRAVMFFSGYIFLMWFYSHRIKKIVFWGNLTSAILAIIPFFAVFVYYKNVHTVIFIHALLLFLLILIKELIKDLENLKGDLVHNYQTIPVKYGENKSKIVISLVVCVCFSPIYVLLHHFDIGCMYIYIIFVAISLLFFIIALWKSNKNRTYVLLHNLLRVILTIGIFSIMLVDMDKLTRILF